MHITHDMYLLAKKIVAEYEKTQQTFVSPLCHHEWVDDIGTETFGLKGLKRCIHCGARGTTTTVSNTFTTPSWEGVSAPPMNTTSTY